MMTQTDLIAEDRRLHILMCLKTSSDYRLSDVLLQAMLRRIGLAASLSVIDGDLSWLEAQGLVVVEELGECTLALLRSEGVDVAEGVAHRRGIAKPRPVN